jgi:iron complex outermembrane recepter protein
MQSCSTRRRRNPIKLPGWTVLLLSAATLPALWAMPAASALAADAGNAPVTNSADADAVDSDAVSIAAASAPNTASSSSNTQNAPGLAEVVVTATRREEALMQVPESVQAITEQNIDTLGIKNFNDVARFTPGVAVDTSGTNTIAIRGIAASAGASTTGVYIGDIPIQMRALGFSPDQTLPTAFDLQRVEVLRGPQGTLFGAGSEGGTVRYILAEPSDTQESTYARSEISYTEGGANNYEVGIAHGGPIIDNELGFRVSAWFRQVGGWIDRYDPYTDTDVDPNSNRSGTLVLRAALVWQPQQDLTITPDVIYQDRHVHDFDAWWSIYSNPTANQFGSGDPTPEIQPDRFYLPMVKVQWDVGSFQLISDTSYYNRLDLAGYDGTLYTLSYFQTVMPGSAADPGYPPSSPYYPLLDNTGVHLPKALQGYTQPDVIHNWQQNWTQEVRLQSNDPSSPLTWTAGVYWETDRSFSSEELTIQSLAEETLLDETLFGAPPATAMTAFGTPLYGAPFLSNGDTYFLHNWGHDEQISGYGELSYNLGPFTMIAGGRYSDTWFNFNTFTLESFLPPAFGNAGRESATPFTPRLGLQYHIDPNNQLYATYSEGFRVGGVNAPIPPSAGCGPSEAEIGKKPPLTYGPDKVQSWEFGDKDSLFGNRIQLANSVYYIKWNGIQQSIYLVSCGLQYTDNVGYAVSKGAEIQADFLITPSLQLQSTAGYNSAYFTQSGYNDVVVKGEAVAGFANPLPTWTTALGLQYNTSVLQHESFARFDYEYQSVNKRLSPALDVRSSQYAPWSFPLPATHFASLRVGTHFGSWEIDAFCDNLFNTYTIINYAQSGVDTTNFNPKSEDMPPPLNSYFSYPPRTIGITALFNR